MRPPVIVVGRARSGTRVVTAILRAAGLRLGTDTTHPQLDSWGWHQRYVVPALIGAPRDASAAARAQWAGAACTAVGPWGFKCPEAALLLPELRVLFPGARFVHVRRDPRAVCLSKRGWFQLGAPLNDPPGWAPGTYAPFCRAVTLGCASQRRWRGLDLDDPAVRGEHRFELQAQAWLHTSAALDRARGDDVIDVAFEHLCADPCGVAQSLAAAIGSLAPDRAASAADALVDASREDAWRRLPLSRCDRRGFERATALLKEHADVQ